MIELYGMGSPNVVKIYIALEELGLPYTVHPVDVFTGRQFDPAFLKLNPMAKVPVITDSDGPGGKPCTLFELGAILLYLAEKTGKLLPQDTAAKYAAIEWMMVQMTTVGPMFGQAVHFIRFAPPGNDYSKSRYVTQVHRVFEAIDRRLGETRVARRRRLWHRRHRHLPMGACHADAARRRHGGEVQECAALGRDDRRTPGGEACARGGGRRPRQDDAVRQGAARDARQGVRPRPVRRRLNRAEWTGPWTGRWTGPPGRRRSMPR